MNTKSLNEDYSAIQWAFDEILEPTDPGDKAELGAKMLMAQFLSQIQEEADRRQLRRKDLAEMIGTSASYLTQLFRGHKLMNLTTAAKFQMALDLKFEIREVSREKSGIPKKDIAEYLNNWYDTSGNEKEYLKIIRREKSDDYLPETDRELNLKIEGKSEALAS